MSDLTRRGFLAGLGGLLAAPYLTEVVGAGVLVPGSEYARQVLPARDVVFSSHNEAWGQFKYFALYNSETGQVFAEGPMGEPLQEGEAFTVTFNAGGEFTL